MKRIIYKLDIGKTSENQKRRLYWWLDGDEDKSESKSKKRYCYLQPRDGYYYLTYSDTVEDNDFFIIEELNLEDFLYKYISCYKNSLESKFKHMENLCSILVKDSE